MHGPKYPTVSKASNTRDAHAPLCMCRSQPGWTIVQHHNEKNRKWKTFHGPNRQAQVKSRAVALQIQQGIDPLAKKTHAAKKTRAAVKIVCQRCGGDTEEGNPLLWCDMPGCGASHHMWCLEPLLARVPEGEWFCPDCNLQPTMPPPPQQQQLLMRPPTRKEPQLV